MPGARPPSCARAAAAIVRSSGFDVVCHLAAQDDVRQSVADPLGDLSVNVAGTVSLLEAVRLSGAPTRFVFSSTGGAIYGDAAPCPTPEFADKHPASPYGMSKLAAERYVQYYGRAHGVYGVVLRYGNVFGPGQDGQGEAGVVAIFCERDECGELSRPAASRPQLSALWRRRNNGISFCR